MIPRAETTLPPVVKSVTVARPVADAFQVFTEGLGSWWPLETHSLGQSGDGRCGCEGGEGGVFWEETQDGTRHTWGTIISWQPPRKLVFTWHPGRDETLAQQVEVSFTAEGDGTRVDLVHTGWEVLGPAAEETRAGYDSGWERVFVQRYAAACD